MEVSTHTPNHYHNKKHLYKYTSISHPFFRASLSHLYTRTEHTNSHSNSHTLFLLTLSFSLANFHINVRYVYIYVYVYTTSSYTTHFIYYSNTSTACKRCIRIQKRFQTLICCQQKENQNWQFRSFVTDIYLVLFFSELNYIAAFAYMHART